VTALGDGRLASASYDATIRIWPKHLFKPSELYTNIKNGNLPKVLELINDGYDINSTKEKSLLVACKHNQLSVVQMLLGLGADIEIKDIQGKTALIYACKMGKLNIVKELLINGANIEATDNNGNTALIVSKKLEIVQVLLNNGADIDAINKEGYTCLRNVSIKNKIDIVKELIKRGANVDIVKLAEISAEIRALLSAYKQNQ